MSGAEGETRRQSGNGNEGLEHLEIDWRLERENEAACSVDDEIDVFSNTIYHTAISMGNAIAVLIDWPVDIGNVNLFPTTTAHNRATHSGDRQLSKRKSLKGSNDDPTCVREYPLHEQAGEDPTR